MNYHQPYCLFSTCPHTVGVRIQSYYTIANKTCRPTACVREWPHLDPSTTANSLIYTFSAKEKDVETGLSYFGSRYYSSDLSIWLSVDPQAAKYPSLSPYVYCANNPIKLVDPNGEEIDEPPAWKRIDPVIPKEKFVGWMMNPDYQVIKNKKSNGEEPNCNDYAKHQLSKVNCYTTGGKDSRTLYPYSKEIGVNKEHTSKSIEYIHGQLENGIPVFVGVDEGVDKNINNGTTDHFIVIVGQGNDNRGNFFLFYDNGTGDITKGTSPNNKLYYNPKSGKISGEVKTRNDMEQTYTISEVRVTNRRKRK